MAFSQVQTATVVNTSGSSAAITLSATAVGDIVIVTIYMAANTETCSSVTDDKSNTYVVQAAVDSPGNERLYQAYGVQVTGGTTTVTVNFSAAVVAKSVFADEYSYDTIAWTSNAVAFDASTTGTGTSTSLSVSTLTPIRTTELIVASMINDNNRTWTAGTNYTLYGGGTDPKKVHSQYRLSGAATETAPATKDGAGTDNWAERATAFRVPQSATLSTDTVSSSDSTNRYAVPNQTISDSITDSDTVNGRLGFQNQSKSSAPTWSNQSKN